MLCLTFIEKYGKKNNLIGLQLQLYDWKHYLCAVRCTTSVHSIGVQSYRVNCPLNLQSLTNAPLGVLDEVLLFVYVTLL